MSVREQGTLRNIMSCAAIGTSFATGTLSTRRASNAQRQSFSRHAVPGGVYVPRVTTNRRSVTRAVVAPDAPAPEVQWSAEMDPLARPPPFTLADIRAAIPKHCWEKSTMRSMSYLFRDVAIVAALGIAATKISHPLMWIPYWIAQGTMFWALFVVGHDAGHQSFSANKKVNDFIGNVVHSSILVPYHGWRISHRTHHANHGHVENDESWHPISEEKYGELKMSTMIGRYSPLALLAYPFYLYGRSPGKSGSHFNPKSDVFTGTVNGKRVASDAEQVDVAVSTACWAVMMGILGAVGFTKGLGFLALSYFIPYLVNVMWLDAVTYLHHTDESVPWYRGEEWSYMRGGISTTDRDYGLFSNIHHSIGIHLVHHLFPQIPHYHLVEATEAVKPVLGEYYREPERAPWHGIPTRLIKEFTTSLKKCRFVPNEGSIVYYRN